MKLLPRLITCLLLSALLLGPFAPAVEAAPAAEPGLAAVTYSAFGYTGLTPAPGQWVARTGIVSTIIQNSDDAKVTLSLGFNFPFFEDTYNQVTVSANGLLLFEADPGSTYATNMRVPSEFGTNALIAPFWDDLRVIGGGEVVYFSPGTGTLVIEWSGVEQYRRGNSLTFQVVLHNNGNFELNYAVLTAPIYQDASFGIEDADGLDGLSPDSVAENTGYSVVRPIDTARRVKAAPVYQGSFVLRGQTTFPLTVYNTGSTAGNTTFMFTPYCLAAYPSCAAWAVEINKGSNLVLSKGTSKQVWVRLVRLGIDPQDPPVGDYYQGRILVYPYGYGPEGPYDYRAFSADFAAAIPATFTTIFVNSGAINMRYVTPDRQATRQLISGYTGSTFGVSRLGEKTYLAAWEMAGIERSTDITKLVTAAGGHILSGESLLGPPNPSGTQDTNPVAAALQDGSAGMVYVRRYTDSTPFNPTPHNTNVYYAHLSATGAVLEKVNLTNDPSFLNYLKYAAPVISPDSLGHIFIAYEVSEQGIEVKHLNGNGAVNNYFDCDPPLGNVFDQVTLAQLPGGKVLLAFVETTPTDSQIRYGVIDASTSTCPILGTLPDPGGALQAAPFIAESNWGVLLGWATSSGDAVKAQRFDSTGQPEGGLISLESAAGYAMSMLSLTGEIGGRMVLSWQEGDYFLTYALLDPDGSVVTPPTAFVRGTTIKASPIGRGLAPLVRYDIGLIEVFLPLGMKSE